MQTYKFTVSEEDVNKRLDIYLHEILPKISRSYLKILITESNILLDEKKTKPSQKLKINQLVTVNVPKPQNSKAEPENIKLDILFEDDDLIVINKPTGMVVHPAAGNFTGTVVNALLYHTKNLSGIGGVIRPGIVHRLDKETSGCLIVAKNDKTHQSLSEQFAKRTIKKIYIALVQGILEKPESNLTTMIRRHPVNRKKMQVHERIGKTAITEYKVTEVKNKVSRIEVNIKTGRTHQIRVHMAYIGHPILGDLLYGGNRIFQNITYNRIMLHAHSIEFTHPTTNKKIKITAPVPFDLNK